MKNTPLFILSFLLSIVFVSYGQKSKNRELTPVRGHYKQLALVSPSPKSSTETIDKQKFPFDQASADRRLSLKPVYLQNISVEDFKIPDAPANSSEQTRAEIKMKG